MSEMITQYESKIDEESDTYKKLETCNGIQHATIEFIARNGANLDFRTLKDILLKVHTVKLDMLTELLHIQLEKAVLAGQLKSKS